MNRSSEKLILATSIPEYIRTISNVAKRVDIFLTDFLSSIEVNLDVSSTANYSIFKNYDPITGACTGSVSRQGAVQPIPLTEGDNIFYIRLTAADNSVVVYTLTIHNEIRSTEAFILDAPDANEFIDNADGSFYASVGNATTTLSLTISSKAKAYVYADADHKVALDCETKSTVDAATGLTATTVDIKLNSMRYTTYYVVIESQVGNRENYTLVIHKGGIVPATNLADISDHWAEENIIAAYDFDPKCISTYKDNIGAYAEVKDLAEAKASEIPYANILVGGFPCQDFSSCGPLGGLETERGKMYLTMVNYMKHHRPYIVIGENVPNLAKMQNGEVLKKIVSDFENAGYKFEVWTLQAKDYGVPQGRVRLIFVGVRKDIFKKF